MNWVDQVKDKLAWIAVAGFTGAVIGWNGWLTNLYMGLRDRPTRAEVLELIRTQAPYVQDKKWIEQAMDSASGRGDKMERVITANTQALQSLKVELSYLRASLERKQ